MFAPGQDVVGPRVRVGAIAAIEAFWKITSEELARDSAGTIKVARVRRAGSRERLTRVRLGREGGGVNTYEFVVFFNTLAPSDNCPQPL